MKGCKMISGLVPLRTHAMYEGCRLISGLVPLSTHAKRFKADFFLQMEERRLVA